MAWELVQEEQAPETGLGSAVRGAGRLAARAGEAIAGAPGDIASGVIGLANAGSRFATGQEIPGASTLQGYLPTSEKIRQKVTQPLTGEYLQPRGGGEEMLDTLVGDIATLLVPGGIATKAGRTALMGAKGLGKIGLKEAGIGLGKVAGRAVGANIVGAGAEALAGPEAGAIAKGLTLGLSNTLGGRRELEKYKKTAYTSADSALSDASVIKNVQLQRTLQKDIEKVRKGVSPERRDILKVLEGAERNFYGVKEKIKPDIAYAYEPGHEGAQIKAPKPIVHEGNIKVRDLWNLKKNINEWMEDPQLAKGTKQQLGKTLSDLNKEIKAYGVKNPKFGIPYFEGEELTKAMNPSTQLRKAVDKNVTLQRALDHWGPLSFAGLVLTKGLGVPVKTALQASGVGAGAAFAAREGIKLGELLYKSPLARQYYLDAVKAAQVGSVTSAMRSLQKFDKAALEYERKNPESSSQPQAQTGWELLPE